MTTTYLTAHLTVWPAPIPRLPIPAARVAA